MYAYTCLLSAFVIDGARSTFHKEGHLVFKHIFVAVFEQQMYLHIMGGGDVNTMDACSANKNHFYLSDKCEECMQLAEVGH